MNRKLLGAHLMAGAAAAAISSGAIAQTGAMPGQADVGAAAGTPASSPAVSPSGSLQEIVVTANKTASNVQKTPIALRVVSGDQLRQSGVADVVGLQKLAPDLNVTTDSLYTKLSLRGVTAESLSEGVDAALSVNIDGEYLNRPVALNASFFDLDRIEVLKGPQGTLYGRNSTAGAINIITAKPTDKFEGYVSGGYGNYNAWNLQGAVNLPVTDTVAVRVAAIHTQHRGYRNLDVDGGNAGRADDQDTTGARATISYKGDRLSAFVQGEYVRVRTAAPAYFGTPVSTASQGVEAFPTTEGGTDFLPIGSTFDLPKTGFGSVLSGRFRSTQYHIRGTLDYELTDQLHLTYVGGYLDSRNALTLPLTSTLNPVQERSVHPHEDAKDWSNELRLTYKSSHGLFVQAGGFYFHEKQNTQNSIQLVNPPFGPPGTDIVYVNDFITPYVNTNSYALFAQANLPITDTLKVTGGVRYSHDKKHGLFYNGGFGFLNTSAGQVLPGIPEIETELGSRPAHCENVTDGNATISDNCYKKSQVNWLGGLEWQVAPQNMLYAKVSTGYRSGGFNVSTAILNGQTIGRFSPEHITAYEAGSKNRFDGGRIEFNLAGFYYDYKNLQVDNFINTTFGVATQNAGKARFWGIEADFVAAITPKDRFTVTANYLNGKYTDFSVTQVGMNDGTIVRNLAGNRPPQAPRITVAAGYDHTFDLGDAGTLKASAYSRLKSSYYLNSYNYAGARQEGFSQSDLSVTWTDRTERISVQGFVHNIENYIPITFAQFTGGASVNIYNYQFGAPRTYGFEVNYKF